MQIDLTKAKDGEFYPVEGTLQLAEALLEGRLATFDSDCALKGQYVMTDGDVVVDAVCTVAVRYQCDKCLEDTVQPLKFRVAEGYSIKPKEGFRYTYQGHTVDLDEAVKEQFLLHMPTKVVCRAECKGLCPRCGANLNETDCGHGLQVEEEAADEASNPFAKL